MYFLSSGVEGLTVHSLLPHPNKMHISVCRVYPSENANYGKYPSKQKAATLKSDQFHISPAASPEKLHYAVGRT